jgi:molybdopterin-guanine dinucleotide biosynthesis protein A
MFTYAPARIKDGGQNSRLRKNKCLLPFNEDEILEICLKTDDIFQVKLAVSSSLC